MKVTVIGAGAVGATAADNIARKQIASEVVILDIKEGFAEGKAMDLAQTASIEGFDTKLVGVTNDYQRTAKSDVIVVTSGLPRIEELFEARAPKTPAIIAKFDSVIKIEDEKNIRQLQLISKEVKKEEKPKNYHLEIMFPNDTEMMNVCNDLTERGYIVKVK
jgi:thioredoxin reductase